MHSNAARKFLEEEISVNLQNRVPVTFDGTCIARYIHKCLLSGWTHHIARKGLKGRRKMTVEMHFFFFFYVTTKDCG